MGQIPTKTMDFSNLKQLNEQSTQDAVIEKRHKELLLDNVRTQQTFVEAIVGLKRFLEGHVTKAEVVNQLQEIGTPDVKSVVNALDSLHKTIKTHENTDLTPVVKVLDNVLQEAKKIPKTQQKIDIPKPIDHAKHFKSLEKAVKAVEKVVKDQKLIAEAPIIHVPEPQVNVEAPDLSPLKKDIQDVTKAVKKVVIPETDTSKVEKELKKSNKLLKEIVEKPVGGGGGGGQAWVATNTSGIPVPLSLDADGKLITTATGGGAGTEYTEGDTDASFTGSVVLVEGAANTAVTLKQPTQPTDTQPVSAASLPLPTGAATLAEQQTQTTHLTNIKTAVETLDNAISGSEMQVDVVGSLPAGTNAIGKLSANSGVDIGDVDVTSSVTSSLDHGSNRDIDTTAEQITSTSFAAKFGVTIKADITNTGIVYIGNSDVTAGTTAATDGFPLSAGETLTLEVNNPNLLYAIASANNQIIYWIAN